MSYTKNTWNTGDIVTSEKLNHIEDGIANNENVMVINYSDGTLDKTWQEIYDAMVQKKLCVIRYDSGTIERGILTDIVGSVYADGPEYMVVAGQMTYSASSANDYPVHSPNAP